MPGLSGTCQPAHYPENERFISQIVPSKRSASWFCQTMLGTCICLPTWARKSLATGFVYSRGGRLRKFCRIWTRVFYRSPFPRIKVPGREEALAAFSHEPKASATRRDSHTPFIGICTGTGPTAWLRCTIGIRMFRGEYVAQVDGPVCRLPIASALPVWGFDKRRQSKAG
jgi:hypothetical protein